MVLGNQDQNGLSPTLLVCLLPKKRKEKNKKEQMWTRVWRRRNPHALVLGTQSGTGDVEKSMEVP